LILLTSDFTYLIFFKFHKLLITFIITQKKIIPKKAPKCVQRVEHSSAKKRTRSPSNEEEEESDRRSTKDRRTKRTQRIERVERSSPKNIKKRAQLPSNEEEEESDERNKKREEATEISWPIPHENCVAETKGGSSKVDLVSDRLIFLLTFY